MNILFDSYNSVFSNPIGGVQKRIKNLKFHLSKCGVNVVLFNKWQKDYDNIDIYHLFKVLPESFEIVKHFKSNGIPIVVSSVFPICKKLNKRLKIKMSVLLHGSYYYIKKILEMADHIIVQTKLEEETIVSLFKLNKESISIIPNGVSDVFFSTKSDSFVQKYDIKEPYVLQVGSIEPNKNQLSVIKAMEGLDASLVLIGGANSLHSDYYQECRKNAGEQVYFINWLDDDCLLASAYYNSQVFILPSYQEIFGNSLFEASMSGTNVISTQVLPLESWGISTMCASIDPNSIADIKAKLVEGLKKQKTEMLSKYIYNNFSWDKVAQQYISVYKKIIKNNDN